jgi:hypothetical protein
MSDMDTTDRAPLEPGAAPPPVAARPPGRAGLHVDRVALGSLLAALGVGWLLAGLGLPVPWHLLPSAGLVLVGLLLLAAAAAGRGIGSLIGLGAVLLLVAIAVGVGADRFGGPVGDRTLTPVPGAWPIDEQIGAGTVTVDLTANPLPATGHLSVSVGAGRVVLLLPAVPPHVTAAVVTGSVTVDGGKVGDGVDVRWSEPAPAAAPTVDVRVATGEVEVRHG